MIFWWWRDGGSVTVSVVRHDGHLVRVVVMTTIIGASFDFDNLGHIIFVIFRFFFQIQREAAVKAKFSMMYDNCQDASAVR